MGFISPILCILVDDLDDILDIAANDQSKMICNKYSSAIIASECISILISRNQIWPFRPVNAEHARLLCDSLNESRLSDIWRCSWKLMNLPSVVCLHIAVLYACLYEVKVGFIGDGNQRIIRCQFVNSPRKCPFDFARNNGCKWRPQLATSIYR